MPVSCYEVFNNIYTGTFHFREDAPASFLHDVGNKIRLMGSIIETIALPNDQGKNENKLFRTFWSMDGKFLIEMSIFESANNIDSGNWDVSYFLNEPERNLPLTPEGVAYTFSPYGGGTAQSKMVIDDISKRYCI